MIFKNKKPFTKQIVKPIEPTISLVMAIAGVLANFFGLLVSLFLSKTHGVNNVIPTFCCLVFQIILFCLRTKIKNYEILNLLLCVICGNILFPTILISDKGINGGFLFYLFLAPAAYGVSINKKGLIVLPILTLAEYIFLFFYIDKNIYPAVGRSLVSNSISFSISYIFVFGFTFFFSYLTKEYNKRLMKMSYHDELTGLYNRRKLEEDLQIKHFRFLAMMDIDDFHLCNNEHGHQFGDLCLKKLADACLFISSDEFKIYRYGGEEFVILSRLSTQDTVKKINDIKTIYNKELGITLSVGIAQNADYCTYQQVLKQADENMFFVKHNGKNNISIDGINLLN